MASNDQDKKFEPFLHPHPGLRLMVQPMAEPTEEIIEFRRTLVSIGRGASHAVRNHGIRMAYIRSIPPSFHANQWSIHQPNCPSIQRHLAVQRPTSGQAPATIRSLSGRLFQLTEKTQEDYESSSSSESEEEPDTPSPMPRERCKHQLTGGNSESGRIISANGLINRDKGAEVSAAIVSNQSSTDVSKSGGISMNQDKLERTSNPSPEPRRIGMTVRPLSFASAQSSTARLPISRPWNDTGEVRIPVFAEYAPNIQYQQARDTAQTRPVQFPPSFAPLAAGYQPQAPRMPLYSGHSPPTQQYRQALSQCFSSLGSASSSYGPQNASYSGGMFAVNGIPTQLPTQTQKLSPTNTFHQASGQGFDPFTSPNSLGERFGQQKKRKAPEGGCEVDDGITLKRRRDI